MAPVATLTLVSHDSNAAAFHIHDKDKKDANEYSKWIAVNGYDAGGVHRTADFKGIRWNEGDPPPDDCDEVVELTNDDAFPVVRREAFVTVFPDVWTPRSNTVEF